LKRDRLEANAVTVRLDRTDAVLRIMHPIDMLQSRNANLHSLVEKQDETGQLQLRLTNCTYARFNRVYKGQVAVLGKDSHGSFQMIAIDVTSRRDIRALGDAAAMVSC
jgi:hypothetical protein